MFHSYLPNFVAYHGSITDLVASTQDRINQYEAVSEKINIFDKYQDDSANDQE